MDPVVEIFNRTTTKHCATCRHRPVIPGNEPCFTCHDPKTGAFGHWEKEKQPVEKAS